MFSLTKITPAIRGAVRQSKFISGTGHVNEIFKIQSQQDFDEKVKNSSEPVIVDFFAT